jgi:hypothetical protein
MVLTLRSWFSEVGIEFKISFKISKLVRQLLIENVMQPYDLESTNPDCFICLVITTTKNTKNLEVRGPEYDKRNKVINYGLWLPYENINNSNNYLREYLSYLFDALVILFNKYQVPESAIRDIQCKVEEEVLDNPEYIYSE